MEKDLVIGFITGYKFDKLKPWIKSLNECGFEGDKILVCYDIDKDVISEIHQHGITTMEIPTPNPFNIVVHRFYHLWDFLRRSETRYRYIITTDVADVIFQTNPSDWLTEWEKLVGESGIIGSSEGLCYRDEPWGFQNMELSFGPKVKEDMKDKGILNAGVIAGQHDYIKDLALCITGMCQGAPLYVPGGGGPDQAAYNVIMTMEPWWENLLVAGHYDGWACQCGTTVDPNKIDSFRPHLLDGEPVWDGEYALSPYGKKYAIVHQYNRVPEWKEVIEKRYE